MTGIVGFIVGALFIASFSITAARAYPTVPVRKLQLFTSAFGLLAIAMLVWALAIIFNNPQSTKELILASDGLLIFATGCMIQLLVGRGEIWLTALLGLVGSLLIGLRAYAYTPAAFVHDGLLYFNLSTSVRAVIIGAFLLFWLPAVIMVASYAAKDKSLPGIQNILSVSFMALIVVTALFVAARRSYVIISLFAIIAALFSAMTLVNIIILKLHKSFGAKHAARATTR
jgi:hypothetical protein